MAPAKQAKIMQDFQKQSAQMDMTVRQCLILVNLKVDIDWESLFVSTAYGLHFSFIYLQTEMMSDAIDDALDNDEAEEETEELTNQVLITFFHCIFFYKFLCCNICKDFNLIYQNYWRLVLYIWCGGGQLIS